MDLDDIYKNPYDKAAHDIYSLYFVGWLFGFLAFIIGFVWAVVQLRKPNIPKLYRSHYQFQMSIAWQGVLIFIVIFGAWYICYPYLSWPDWWRGLVLTISTIFLPIYWWIKRCILGFRLLRRDKQITNPQTFLWPKSNI